MAIVRCRLCGHSGQLGNTVVRKFLNGKLTTICHKCLEAYHSSGEKRIPKEKA